MEEHGILMDIDEVLTGAGKVVTKQYSTPGSRRSTHLEPQDINRQVIPQHQYLRSTRAAPAPPSSSPSPKPAFTVMTDVPMERAPSRAHPPSPVGPRPQKARPSSLVSPLVARPQSSFAAPTRQPFQADAPSVSSPQSPGQAHAQSLFLPFQARGLPVPMRRGSAPVAGPRVFSSINAGYRASEALPSHGVIHSPVPVRAHAASVLPMITAPRVQDVNLQRNLDQYAEIVNTQAVSWNAARPSAPPPAEANVPEPMDIADVHMQIEQDDVQHRNDSNEAQCSMVVDDKENWDAGAPHARAHSHADGGGLGFGQSVPMAKEMGNIVFFNEPQTGKAPKKDRRSRRTCHGLMCGLTH